MSNNASHPRAWESVPLCSRYFVVFVGSRSASICDNNEVCSLSFHWALGALADGDCEVLGAWPEVTAGVTPWQQVFDDFTTRGVERIQFIATAEPSAVPAPPFGATMVPIYALAPRCQRLFVSAQVAARQMNHSLIRAVAKAGSFADREDALSFLGRALRRLDPGLSTGLAGLPVAVHRASRSGTASGVPATAL